MNKRPQTGFTIVELAIATMVFASVLLLVTFGLLSIGKSFAKSVNEARTRAAANSIVEDVSNAIRFSGGEVTPMIASGPNEGWMCVDNRHYTWRTGSQIQADDDHAFVALNLDSGCNAATGPQDLNNLELGSTELLSQGMFLDEFHAVQTGTIGYFEVFVRVVFGDISYFDNTTNQCRAQDSTYCAVTEVHTVIQRRIR